MNRWKEFKRQITPYRPYIAGALLVAAVGLWYGLYANTPQAQPPTNAPSAQAQKPSNSQKPRLAVPTGRPLRFALPPMLEEEVVKPPTGVPPALGQVAYGPKVPPIRNPFAPFPTPEDKKTAPKAKPKRPPSPKPPPPPLPPPAPRPKLELYTEPPAAKVYLDGELLGVTPLRREIPPGEHVLLVELEGRAPIVRQITADPGQTMVLTFWLGEAPRKGGEEAPPAPSPAAAPRTPSVVLGPQLGAEVPPNPARVWAEDHQVKLRGVLLGAVPVALLEVDGKVLALVAGEELDKGVRLVGVGPTTAVLAYQGHSIVLRLETEEAEQ